MDGTFTLYYDATDGKRKAVPGATWPSLALARNGGQSTQSFVPPPDPQHPGEYVLVFKGKLGDEDGAVVGKMVKLPVALAFSSDRTGRFQIWTVQPDDPAGTLQPVTFAGSGNQESRGPDWSLTQDRIAYQFGAPGVRGIHVIMPDGSGDVRVTFSPTDRRACTRSVDSSRTSGDRRDASWSPDGRFIVFACEVSPGDFDLWIHTVGDLATPDDDVEYPLLTRPGSLELRPAWSPDGTKIAFVTSGGPVGPDAEIAVVDVTEVLGVILPSGPVTLLTNNTFIDFDPTWSPDSKEIAFSSTRSGGRDIYRMDVGCPEAQPVCPAAVQLTTSPATDSNPAWSPDGTLIAFVSDRDGNREIFVMSATKGEADTATLKNITQNSANDDDPTWSR
jgi:TolB protein